MQRRHALLALWVVVLAAFSARADDFYVDAVNGSDISGDGSQANPWKTITFSLSQIPGNGDTLWISPGLYDTELGESFPLRPNPNVSLISTGGASVTTISGVSNTDVIVLPGGPTFTPSEPLIEGLTLKGGKDGVVLKEALGERVIVTLVNNTITANQRAGVYGGAGRAIHDIKAYSNVIQYNSIGILHGVAYPFLTTLSGWMLSGNTIQGNTSHGVAILDGDVTTKSTNDVIRNNGGVGWWQSTTEIVHTTLTNSTISGNAGGGLYTHADVQIFPGYYGYYYFDPSATIQTLTSVVYGNGGFGGAQAAGTSLYVRGTMSTSVAWGNAGLDNVNFDPIRSNIGTGHRNGTGVISANPKFVDPGSGDFRLRRDSPCLDAAGTTGPTPTDFEGEDRGFDGDSNGVGTSDMGIDEFHTMVFPGVPAVRGQSFHFVAQAPPAEDGNLVTVLISGSRGGESGGIVLPGSGGQAVDLTADALFALGLGLAPLFNTTLAGGEGQTPALVIPNTPFTGDIFYAGVSIDLTSGQYVSITPTHSLGLQ